MKIYMAPLEGLTTVFLRQNYDKYFGKIDKYYIPFLEPKGKIKSTKDQREVNTISNKLKGKVVPQIISKNIEDTIYVIDELYKLGYDEVNLNFGCPSKTVTTKGKGAGMLSNLEYMDKYLKEIIASSKAKISVKLRLGNEDVSEIYDILNVLNKHDILELIIHPRDAKGLYSSKLSLDMLDDINKYTKFDIIYNGEINSLEDLEYIQNRFPFIKGVMIGRGLIRYPDIFNIGYDIDHYKEYYFSLSNTAYDILGNNATFFIHGFWNNFILNFNVEQSLKKKLLKAKNQLEFDKYSNELFKCATINTNRISIKDFI